MERIKRSHEKEHEHLRWYRLDNAAKLYPAIESERVTTFFRLAITLHEEVDPVVLQKALIRVIDRFPYYRVRLRQGIFWFYIEHNPKEPVVEPDEQYPCMRLNMRRNRQYLFRVRYYKGRIALELSHMLTDGTGGMIFLKTLVAEYLRLQGVTVPVEEGVLPLDEIYPGEDEDAYNRFYKPTIPVPNKESQAFHIPDALEAKGVYLVTTGVIPLQAILGVAKAHSLTLTEFLTTVYLEALQTIQEQTARPSRVRPIRLSVPVNLRKLYPSSTMRNFSLYVKPGIDPRLGHYSFEEIARAVHHNMRSEVNDKSVSREIRRNVGGEKLVVVKFALLFIKKWVLSIMYHSLGEQLHSGSLSNLGLVTFPQAMAEQVARVDFIPGPNPVNKSGASVVSYGDSLYISFGRVIREAELERLFFTRLIKFGIPVRVESNQ